jgi:hypothetical protein
MAGKAPQLTVEKLNLVSWGNGDAPPSPELDENFKAGQVIRVLRCKDVDRSNANVGLSRC